MNIILLGTLASFCAGLATSLGAIPVFFIRKLSDKAYASMLGFAAGIMLAATFFSLLIPALKLGGIFKATIGFVAGVIFLELVEKFVPHEHFLRTGEKSSASIKRIILFVIAITIHNFPEGLSVGVGFGTGDIKKAIALAIGIGIQNIPEGAAVALPLHTKNYSKWQCLKVAALTGLVEPIGGFLGVALVVMFTNLLPYALSFASGCMLYVVSGDIIPESHREGHYKYAKIWLIIGFVVMMLLDNIF